MAEFLFQPDWAKGLVERWRFLTDVQTAWDGTEQRVRGRTRPRVELEFEAFAAGGDAPALAAWLADHQGGEFGVPYWPVDAGWLAAARALEPIEVKWTTPALGRAPCKLALRDGPLVADAVPETLSGRDAFFNPPPDWAEPLSDQWRRTLDTLDFQTGPYRVRDRTGFGLRRITFAWRLAGGMAIARARRFVLNRQGRLHTAWWPGVEAGAPPWLGRLDQDDIEWRWIHPALCRLTLGVLSTPREVG